MNQEESQAFHTLVGQRIKQFRLMKGMSAATLAEKVGLQRSTISNIENAKQKVFGETLWEIAKALECDSLDQLSPPIYADNEMGYQNNLNRDQQDALKWVNSRVRYTDTGRLRSRSAYGMRSKYASSSRRLEKMFDDLAKDLANDMAKKMKLATKEFERSLKNDSEEKVVTTTNKLQNV